MVLCYILCIFLLESGRTFSQQQKPCVMKPAPHQPRLLPSICYTAGTKDEGCLPFRSNDKLPKISASLLKVIYGDGSSDANLSPTDVDRPQLIAHFLLPFLKLMAGGDQPALETVIPLARSILQNPDFSVSVDVSDAQEMSKKMLMLAADQGSFLSQAADMYGFRFKLDTVELALAELNMHDNASSGVSLPEGLSLVSMLPTCDQVTNVSPTHQYDWTIELPSLTGRLNRTGILSLVKMLVLIC